MAITVKHKFVSAIPDAGDPTIVQPSNWNDDHQLTGTVPVANGGTGASSLTGYVIGNGTSAMTASTTIPSTAITGLGTMSTQNANSVAITGGTLNGVAIGGTTAGDGTFDILTSNVSRLNTATATTLTIGTLPYTPANALITAQSSATSYNQVIISNTNGGAAASADYIVNNDLSTDTTYYGDFGMNSSGFTGTGALSQTNAVYLTSTSADLAIGTTTSNSIHFVVAGGATDAITINTTKSVAFNGSYGTAGQVLTSGGSTGVPTWTTPTTGTVTSVSGTAGHITSTGGNTPVIDLASGIATAGTTGSSTLIPVITIDTYGRVTSITTASNPQGTVTSVAALTLGTTGTDLSSTVATGTTTPVITLNVPTASATNRGALSAADWTTFNSKQPAGTYVTSVAATSPVTSTGGTTPTIAMPAATTSVSGYLTSTDWNTFNNKQPSGTYINSVSGTTNQITATTTTGAVTISLPSSVTTGQYIANQTVSGSSTKGAFAYGTLGYSDSNHLATFQTAVNAYAQVEIQNTQAGTAASADMVVGNDLTTSSTYYGDFGINSSLFSGTGSLGLANATYLTATTGDLSLGTTTSNAIHFVIGGSATDAMTISTAGLVTANSFASSSAAITGGSVNSTPVGATTASTGAFTTLSASSTVSGTGFSTYLASPPAIGGTAAAAITGTTITATKFVGVSGGTF